MSIAAPPDLAALSTSELDALAAEIRAYLVGAVGRTGGHPGPNRGVVELTLAPHRVHDSPRDRARLQSLPRAAVDVADAPTVVRHEGGCDVLREDVDARVLLAAADEPAAHDVPVTVVDPQWIAPPGPGLLELAATHRLVLAAGDTTATGARGARLAQALAATTVLKRLSRMVTR